ncbi:MAG TPA: hypothetical protein VJB57_03050 [Dehalococcoidia bacterium]|nr:hypothetical protein [Dehalococcoidia bacterium]
MELGPCDDSNSANHVQIKDNNRECVFLGWLSEIEYITTTNDEGGGFRSDKGVASVAKKLALIVSIASGIATVVFVVMLAAGYTRIEGVKAENLVGFTGVTLLGSIFSIGGIELSALKFSLSETKEVAEAASSTVFGASDSAEKAVRAAEAATERAEEVARRLGESQLRTPRTTLHRFSFSPQDRDLLRRMQAAMQLSVEHCYAEVFRSPELLDYLRSYEKDEWKISNIALDDTGDNNTKVYGTITLELAEY